MQIQQFLAIALFGNQCIFTDASYVDIAGYSPASKVTSHNAIDLDQWAIQIELGETSINYNKVQEIYENGGNSKTYAEFPVASVSSALSKGDAVVGTGVNGNSALSGKMYSNIAATSTFQVSTIKVSYPTSDNQATYVNCKGGALRAHSSPTPMTPYILTDGCFTNASLTVTALNGQVTLTPTGPVTNKAGRTLQGFSTKAQGTMYEKNVGCAGASDRSTDGCPYFDFTMYYRYYGSYDYANRFVLAAITGQETRFGNGDASVNMNFNGQDDALRKECIKKGTAYMNAYMYAIREFEDAIDDCVGGCSGGQCNSLSLDASVHAWDEGVAFYTGSLEGQIKGGNSDGKLSYRLAEKRCVNFKTCGQNSDLITGTSYVNTKLFEQLDIGKTNLLAGKCEETRPVVRKMVALMSIPLIQGTLRYAYKISKQNDISAKSRGEGAVFAAAIVPRVAHCNSASASTIMTNMRVGATSTDFVAIKSAFELTYDCMNITCAEVGGLWSGQDYYVDADPCSFDEVSGASPHPSVLLLAKVITVMAMVFHSRGQ